MRYLSTLILALVFALSSLQAFAQCSPNTSIDPTTIIATDPANLPDGDVGQAYTPTCVTVAMDNYFSFDTTIAVANLSAVAWIDGVAMDSTAAPAGMAYNGVGTTSFNESDTTQRVTWHAAFELTGTPTAGADTANATVFADVTGFLQVQSPGFPPLLPAIDTIVAIEQTAALINGLGLPIPVDALPFPLPDEDGSLPVNKTFTINGATSIDEALASEVSVYPNPITSTSRLHLELERTANIQVDLLDLNGRVVRRIANETLPAGQHSFAVCQDCASLPAGVYSLRTVANGQVAVQKIVLN